MTTYISTLAVLKARRIPHGGEGHDSVSCKYVVDASPILSSRVARMRRSSHTLFK